MMKKFLTVLLALAMVLALAACGGGNSAPADSGTSTPAPDAQQPAEGGSELITVGVINNDPNESGYRTANDKAMRDMFTEANGYKATFYNNNDAAQQIATAQQMVQDEVDFLLLSPRLHHRLGHRAPGRPGRRHPGHPLRPYAGG